MRVCACLGIMYKAVSKIENNKSDQPVYEV